MIKNFGYNLAIKKRSGSPKIALFLGHLGLGDQIWLSGAVRYIAPFYDYVHLVCKVTNLKTLEMLYSDLSSIKFITVYDGYSILPTPTSKGYCFPIPDGKYVAVYECGFYKRSTSEFNMHDLPGAFYDDLSIPRSVRSTHFVVPNISESVTLYNQIKERPYIFVQTRSSEQTTDIVSWDIHSILTIDPNINQYAPDHPWYEIARMFVNKPFLHYMDTIKHATELHMVNSSFYTLASQLSPLDATVKKCYDRDTKEVMPQYDYR